MHFSDPFEKPAMQQLRKLAFGNSDIVLRAMTRPKGWEEGNTNGMKTIDAIIQYIRIERARMLALGLQDGGRETAAQEIFDRLKLVEASPHLNPEVWAYVKRGEWLEAERKKGNTGGFISGPMYFEYPGRFWGPPEELMNLHAKALQGLDLILSSPHPEPSPPEASRPRSPLLRFISQIVLSLGSASRA